MHYFILFCIVLFDFSRIRLSFVQSKPESNKINEICLLYLLFFGFAGNKGGAQWSISNGPFGSAQIAINSMETLWKRNFRSRSL